MNGTEKNNNHEIGDLIMRRAVRINNSKKTYIYVLGIIINIRIDEYNKPTAYPWGVKWFADDASLLGRLPVYYTKGEITKYKKLLEEKTK